MYLHTNPKVKCVDCNRRTARKVFTLEQQSNGEWREVQIGVACTTRECGTFHSLPNVHDTRED